MSKINKIKVNNITYDIEDLSVPNWAKAENKPTYSYNEIQNTPDLSTKQDVMQYDTMPVANASNLGKIIQYIGSTSTYTNGYFYKCVVDNNVYNWEQINVQPGGSGGTSDYEELTNKPTINNVELTGNKSTSDLGIVIPTNSDFTLNGLSEKSYNNLTDKPTIPVVPTNVSAFNNDVGYTTNVGTITSVKMNGSTIASSGEADLGTVLTQHQDISGKLDTSKVKSTYSTTSGDVYDVSYINTIIGDISSALDIINGEVI